MKQLIHCLKQHRFVLFTGLLYLFCHAQARSQTFSIPDANFRNCLKETYPEIFDVNNNLIIAEAKKIRKIECIRKGIQSLEGIGYFEGLESLNIGSNQLQEIPEITTLTKLRDLVSFDNRLTAMPDLSGNTALVTLDVTYNEIAVFPDLTNNPNIRSIYFTGNQIQSLPDLSALTFLYDLKVNDNPIQSLPDLSDNLYLSDLDIGKTPIQVFPDLSHNVYLRAVRFGGNPQFNTFPDIAANTNLELIDCSQTGLSVIPDLSAYTNLQILSCYGNNLTSLPDLSRNPKLNYVVFDANHLTQLPDLSKCPQLEFLSCRNNQLTQLPDLSGNTALARLLCDNNNLTSLPNLANTKIGKGLESIFSAKNNRLTFEDILPLLAVPVTATVFEYKPQQKLSQNSSKTGVVDRPFTIDLNIDDNVTSSVYTWYKNNVPIATNSSNVFTIEQVKVSDAGQYRVTVTNPNVPGLVLESGVTTLTVDPALGWIPDPKLRACLKETYPWAFNSQDYVILAEVVTIRDISCIEKGISDATGLEYFTGVENINLAKNQISEVPDLSALKNLYRLFFHENNISALPDLSACTVLQELHFNNNNFSAFPDVSGNAARMMILEFGHNHLTSIPDLSVYQKLNGLYLSFNPIETFPDLSPNQKLTSLWIDGVSLQTFPDLSKLANLEFISFGYNPQFSTWPDLSKNLKLTQIDCRENGLTFIPSLSVYRHLFTLVCSDNKLTELPELSGLTELQGLVCPGNNLHSLPDLSHTRLGDANYSTCLVVSDNHLTYEDLLPLVKGKTYSCLVYTPQTVTAVDQVVTKDKNEPFVIDINIDDAVTNNVYKWYKDGVLVRTTSTNKLSFDHVQAADAGTYTCVITNPDATDLAITWQKITLKVNTVVPPWEPVTGGTSNHVVVIPNNVVTDIYGTTIQTGDYAGIFFKDGSNALRASGSARWTGANTAITVWGKSDQGTKNGFDTGEEMVVMIWKADEQKSYVMSATYDMQLPYTDRGNFRANGFSKVLTMKVLPVCQRIDLHTGWNLISTYIKATDLSMVSIFGNTNGVVVKDASGMIKYAPGFGITGGSWNTAEGYLVYSPAEQSFEVCGRPINPVTPVSLTKNSYPAFLPYYGDAEIAVGDGLKGLGTNYSYAQTITYSGGTGQLQAYNYIPAHVINPPIDQIGYMRPGLAYKILLQGDVAAFSYPAYISSTGGRIRSDEATLGRLDHFGNVKPLTANNAVLVIPDNLFSQGLSAGDEIGVFSSRGELIGAIAYAGTPMAVTLWESGASGTADAFTVRLWRMEDRKEYTVDLTYANRAEGKFFPNTLLIANGAQLRDGQEFSDGIKVYPNPANNDVQVTLYVADEGTVRIVLYDMMGRERGELFNGILPRGVHQKTVDLSAIPAGQYVYKVNVNHAVTSDKLVIVK